MGAISAVAPAEAPVSFPMIEPIRTLHFDPIVIRVEYQEALPLGS